MDKERLKEQDEKNKAALKELYDKEIVEASNQMFDQMTEDQLVEVQKKLKTY